MATLLHKAKRTSGYNKVEAFKEKPNKETVLKYVEASNFFWNVGIFV